MFGCLDMNMIQSLKLQRPSQTKGSYLILNTHRHLRMLSHLHAVFHSRLLQVYYGGTLDEPLNARFSKMTHGLHRHSVLTRSNENVSLIRSFSVQKKYERKKKNPSLFVWTYRHKCSLNVTLGDLSQMNGPNMLVTSHLMYAHKTAQHCGAFNVKSRSAL